MFWIAGLNFAHIDDNNVNKIIDKKGKAVPVTGREGPYVCERSRLPHFLDNRLIDGGKAVSLTGLPPFTLPGKFLVLFLLEAESTPGP
jgi:hypothetical protein